MWRCGLKNGALRKLCQKISASGVSTTSAVIATTDVRGKLKLRAIIAGGSWLPSRGPARRS